MRILVAFEGRFLKTQNGNIYSTTVCDYGFWRSYLQVFDEILVLARVKEIQETKLDIPPANGPNVSFLPLPNFRGPWQYLKKFYKINAAAKRSIQEADAFLLHVPSNVCSVLWRHLKRQNIPYAVEVAGDPWDSLAPGTVKSILRGIIRIISRRNLIKQCRGAFAATYVTEFALQKRYPTNGWQTYFSDVNLPDNAIVKEERLAERLEYSRKAANGQRPFRICHTGYMDLFYKCQDVLIEAVSLCRKRGWDIELILLGTGKYYQYYLDKARQLGSEKYVKFLGKVPPGQAVINQLDAADLFVLPSMTEGMPRSLLEAMARGLPCISSPVGGIPELLKPEDLVHSGDPEALAFKIESVLSDMNLLGKMARRNLEKAKQYRDGDLNKRRIEFHRKILEKARRKS